jgi:acyl carrier protein
MALTQDSALALIFEAITNLNAERGAESQIPLSLDTVLFGGSSLLDSLALVSVISDVEMAVSDTVGEAVSLTDDQALSQEVSPFTSVRTLAAYILQVTGGKA